MMLRTCLVLACLTGIALGCGGTQSPQADDSGIDAGNVDAGNVDAGNVDAGTVDAGNMDAGTVDAGTIDAGTIDAGNMDAGTTDAGTLCTVTAARVSCSHRSLYVTLPLALPRQVHFQTPEYAAPDGGRPTVIFFQGTGVSGEYAFAADKTALFGQYDLARTVKALLDQGYVVIAPEAQSNGTTAWQTNIPPTSFAWTGSADDQLVKALFTEMTSGSFGPVDPKRLYAMGISSGGYMTSRMAVSYPGKFRALAVASASYATCSSTCTIPTLPANHPPTLFLHGQLDPIVPIATMLDYRDRLNAIGIEVRTVIDPNGGHAWLPSGPQDVTSWFGSHQ